MAQLAANDKIQMALIGAGGMGTGDARDAVATGQAKIVAVSDIYEGRLERAKERWGNDLFVTRDFRQVLQRKEIDAVIIATPDHWHGPIAEAALRAGKDVYVEKPMVHKFAEGERLVKAQQETGKILQVGSQYASSAAFQKAEALLQAGAIGSLNLVEAWLDRNTALGAWQYSLPTDATPERIDWEQFLGNAPKRPFEPVRLFRWRNYGEYGTGVSGDLFVHLLTGLHMVTHSKGPNRIYSSGGVRYWKDGRDAYDVALALMDYPATEAHPEFTFSLRVNLASGAAPPERFGLKFVGSEGTMEVSMTSVVVERTPPAKEPGYTVGEFPAAIQKAVLAEYHRKYPKQAASAAGMAAVSREQFQIPRDHNPHLEHVRNFCNAVRSRKPFFEDAVFGYRTAGPALAVNESLRRSEAVAWDPEKMKLV